MVGPEWQTSLPGELLSPRVGSAAEAAVRDVDHNAVLSHDMRECLRTITAYLDLLDRRYGEELPPDAKEYLGFAAGGATRLRRLVDDYLAFSTTDKPTTFTSVPLEPVLNQALVTLQARILETDATVVVGDLPTVVGDEAQLVRVFENLIGNALKYSDCPPTVLVNGSETDDAWRVSVTDNGVGMDPVRADRIFEPFVRLHGRDEYEGSGIGLAVCARIVADHGGAIAVETAPGAGSTFTIHLPKQADVEAVEPVEPVEDGAGATKSGDERETGVTDEGEPSGDVDSDGDADTDAAGDVGDAESATD